MSTAVHAEALAEREAKAEKLRSDIARLETELDQTVRESLRKAPKQRPFALRSPADQLKKRIADKRRELEPLATEIGILREQSAELDRERAQKTLAAAVKQLRDLEAKQPAVWQQMRARFAEVVATWQAEAEGLAAKRQQVHARAAGELAAHNDLLGELDRAYASTRIPPLPSSLPGAFRKLEAETFGDASYAFYGVEGGSKPRSAFEGVEVIRRGDPGWTPPEWRPGVGR